MRILSNLFTVLFSVILIFIATCLFLDISRLQSSLQQFNDASDLEISGTESTVDTIKIDKDDFRFLSWDSEVNQALATVNSSLAMQESNKGQQQIYLSKAHYFYQQSLRFTPKNINSIIGNLSLLIDHGAPLNYFLPRINDLALLTPKDQDLRAEIAMLVFKLSVLYQDEQSQTMLINSLNKLFKYSMDYRGMTQVRRYANLFDQKELLTRVATNVKK